jgi:hypothetical protein
MVDRTWLLMELMARGPAPGMFYVLLVPVRHQGVALSSQWPTCLTSALTQDGAAIGVHFCQGGAGRGRIGCSRWDLDGLPAL